MAPSSPAPSAAARANAEIQDGKIDGDNLSFTMVRGDFKIEYKGKLSGDEIKFDVNVADQTLHMTVKRQ